MSKELWLILFLMIMMHFAVFSYFDEFLVARHPLFKCKMRMSKVVGFGRSKVFHRARTGAIEFYTIISYYEQNKEHTAKISRGMGDEIGKKVLVAVEENDKLTVRYEKYDWYGENYSEEPIKGIGGLKFSIFMYVFSHISMICWLMDKPDSVWKSYQIYILTAVMHYLFLPQLVKIRNYIWGKSMGRMQINDNEITKGMIAFFSILVIGPYSFFLYVAMVIKREVGLTILVMGVIVFYIFLIILCARKMKEKEKDESFCQDSKIILAEVILVDNVQEPKKLICQVKNGQEVMQYQKIQYINFLEKIGDFVEVRVELADARNYEVLNRIGN